MILEISHGRGSTSSATRQSSNTPRKIIQQLAARRAPGQMGVHRGFLGRFQQPFQIIARQIFNLQVRHSSLPASAGSLKPSIRFRTRASSNRPRFIRDFTVPSGTPRHFGDFQVVQIMKVAEHHRLTQVGGKPVQTAL